MRSSRCLAAGILLAVLGAVALAQAPAQPEAKPATQPAKPVASHATTQPADKESQKPRTLEGYVEQEKDFYKLLLLSLIHI